MKTRAQRSMGVSRELSPVFSFKSLLLGNWATLKVFLTLARLGGINHLTWQLSCSQGDYHFGSSPVEPFRLYGCRLGLACWAYNTAKLPTTKTLAFCRRKTSPDSCSARKKPSLKSIFVWTPLSMDEVYFLWMKSWRQNQSHFPCPFHNLFVCFSSFFFIFLQTYCLCNMCEHAV